VRSTETAQAPAPVLRRHRIPTAWLVMLLLAVLASGIAVAVALGASDLRVSDVIAVIAARLRIGPPVAATTDFLVWDVRLPRALLAALVGASLAVSGAALQALVGNSLADPYVLGVSSGAGLAAAASMLLGIAAGGFGLQVAAFIGACVAMVIVLVLATAGRASLTTARLLLSGVAVSYLFSGLTSYFVLTADRPQAAQSVMFWLVGSLGAADWPRLGLPAAALVVGTGWLLWRASAMDALSQGEETAQILGFSPRGLRIELLTVASLTTGVSVAVSGGIGFVGLMLPHLVRLVRGPAHAGLLPLSLLAGAGFLVWCDILARLVAAPAELPIGVVTSVIGAPVFAVLLVRSRRVG